MILLWFLFGILLAFGIARYNESNKLFWTLAFAFVMGFAGAKMVLDTVDNESKSNGNLTQVYSTQGLTTTLSTLSYYIASDESKASNVVTAQNPVSQSNMPALEDTIILSEVGGKTRDQPIVTHPKPPELWLQKDSSTAHDFG